MTAGLATGETIAGDTLTFLQQEIQGIHASNIGKGNVWRQEQGPNNHAGNLSVHVNWLIYLDDNEEDRAWSNEKFEGGSLFRVEVGKCDDLVYFRAARPGF